MRKSLAVVALLAGAFGLYAPASASAYCTVIVEELGCWNPCTPVGYVWGPADQATGGKVLGPLYCYA